MIKRRTPKSYTLTDGQIVTTRQVADEIGITESAARNRLIHTDDPKKVFAPYTPSANGRSKPPAMKKDKVLPYEDNLWKLAMRVIGGKK
tara:strand:- start:36 stop:302 length:267 start_codon:yes stop_codon:yes gene_type:complete